MRTEIETPLRTIVIDGISHQEYWDGSRWRHEALECPNPTCSQLMIAVMRCQRGIDLEVEASKIVDPVRRAMALKNIHATIDLQKDL